MENTDRKKRIIKIIHYPTNYFCTSAVHPLRSNYFDISKLSICSEPSNGSLLHLNQSLNYFPCLHSQNDPVPSSLSLSSLIPQHSPPSSFWSSRALSWNFPTVPSTFLPQGIPSYPFIGMFFTHTLTASLCTWFSSLLKHHLIKEAPPDNPTHNNTPPTVPLLYPAFLKILSTT